jgi:hypothetical protein
MRDIQKVLEEIKAEILPFESWERLPGETSAAYAAFCVYRDFGTGRNIRKAVAMACKDVVGVTSNSTGSTTEGNLIAKRYKVWRNFSMQYRWRERAEAYDNYIDRLKQAELRKTIEAQGEVQRQVTGKMLLTVSKKLDMMDAGELEPKVLSDWVSTAIKAERDAAAMVMGSVAGAGGGAVVSTGSTTGADKQIVFQPEFEGI